MVPHPVKVAVKFLDQFHQVLNIPANIADIKTVDITVKETIRSPTKNERNVKQQQIVEKFEILTKIQQVWETKRTMALNVAHNRHKDRLIVIIARMYEELFKQTKK